MIPLICDPLPSSITVENKEIPVLTDFRYWLICAEIMQNTAPLPLKAELCRMTVCPNSDVSVTASPDTFLLSCASFLLQHDLTEHDLTADTAHINNDPCFDFEQDSALIFASFMSAYHIDLTTEKMHWHKFMALLSSLPCDSPLMKTISLRLSDPSEIEDDHTRRALRRAKNAVRIKQNSERRNLWTAQ